MYRRHCVVGHLSGVELLLSIPNRTVKRASADNSSLATGYEGRSWPAAQCFFVPKFDKSNMYIYHMYMKYLPDILKFEWDKGNLDKSYNKHGITHKEAEEIFVSEEFFVIEDIAHSQSEPRYIGLGKTIAKVWLFVVFTIRKESVRIISARRMHREEVDRYESTKKNTKV